jgi:hypothetical protein
MGSYEDIPENKKPEYLAGLKKIIAELHANGDTDSTVVAREISAYRSRFLQDPTRLLTFE